MKSTRLNVSVLAKDARTGETVELLAGHPVEVTTDTRDDETLCRIHGGREVWIATHWL